MGTFNTLHGVIENYLLKNTLGQDKYFPLLAHANSWFNERDRVLAPNRATVEIQLQNDRTAVLPDDFIDWLTVGRTIGTHVYNLAFNSRVSWVDSPDAQPPVPALSADPWGCQYGGYLGGSLWGWGAPRYEPEEFTIDWATRTLRCSSQVPEGPLYLQYLYNPDKPGVRTPLDTDMLMVVELWMEWQSNRRAPDARMLEAQYHKQVKKVARLREPFTPANLYNIVNNTAYGL